jgi:ribosome maturation factor RimP
MKSFLDEKIIEILTPILEEKGFELIEINLLGSRNSILQLVVERSDRKNITIDDCVSISKSAGVTLDVEDFIKNAYRLEVTSPGIDRKLTKLEHFERYKGFEAKIEPKTPLNGHTNIKCQLCGVRDSNSIRLRLLNDGKLETDEVSILFSNVKKAKLILTDELIQASQSNQIQTI